MSHRVNIECGQIIFKNNNTIRSTISADEYKNIVLSNNLFVTKSADIGHNLSVNGRSDFIGQVRMSNKTNAHDIGQGALTVDGGLSVAKDVFIGDDLVVKDQLYVKGSAHFDKKLNVKGDIIVNGQLQSNNVLKNYIVVDANNNTNSGMLVKLDYDKAMTTNATESGYVITDDVNNLCLSGLTQNIHGYYIGWLIKFIVSDSGEYIVRRITEYCSHNEKNIVTLNCDLPYPVGDYNFELYNNVYCGIIFDPLKHEFIFCDTSNINGTCNNTINIHANGAIFDGVVICKALFQPSDERLKENIIDISIDDALNIIKQLQVKEYNWKHTHGAKNRQKEIGLIAQEVEKIMPELVNTDQHGMKSICYSKLVPILLRTTQHLVTMLEDNQI